MWFQPVQCWWQITESQIKVVSIQGKFLDSYTWEFQGTLRLQVHLNSTARQFLWAVLSLSHHSAFLLRLAYPQASPPQKVTNLHCFPTLLQHTSKAFLFPLVPTQVLDNDWPDLAHTIVPKASRPRVDHGTLPSFVFVMVSPPGMRSVPTKQFILKIWSWTNGKHR